MAGRLQTGAAQISNRSRARRTGLFMVALPFGLVAGIAAGVVVGVWYASGGRLPTDRTPIHG